MSITTTTRITPAPMPDCTTRLSNHTSGPLAEVKLRCRRSEIMTSSRVFPADSIRSRLLGSRCRPRMSTTSR
jgi:hypothetical protein